VAGLRARLGAPYRGKPDGGVMTQVEESHIRAAIAERERVLSNALVSEYYLTRPWQLDEMRAGIERLRAELTTPRA
jgi:hypothetical protein